MSSYISFYVRKNDVFCPIGTFSRSDKRYEFFRYQLPYGKCIAIDEDTLSLVRGDVDEEKKNINRGIEDARELMNNISSWNDPFEERIECISNIIFEVREREEELKELSMINHFLFFLSGILEEATYGDMDNKKYLYVGIDAPTPTPDNVL